MDVTLRRALVASSALALAIGCNALNGVGDLVPVGDLPGDGGDEPVDAGGDIDATVGLVDARPPPPDGALPDASASDASPTPVDAGVACKGLTMLLRLDKDLTSAQGQAPSNAGLPNYVAGQFGSALALNDNAAAFLGYAAQPSAGNVVVSASAGTVAMWVKSSWAFPCVEAHTFFSLLDSVGPASLCDPAASRIGTGADAGFLGLPGAFIPFSASPPWTVNAWNHVAATWSGPTGTITFTLNGGGTPASHRSAPGYFPGSVTADAIRFGSPNALQADIDDVGVWTRALSLAEIQAIYLAGQSIGDVCGLP